MSGAEIYIPKDWRRVETDYIIVAWNPKEPKIDGALPVILKIVQNMQDLIEIEKLEAEKDEDEG